MWHSDDKTKDGGGGLQTLTTISLFILLPLSIHILLLGTDGKAKTAGELPRAVPGEAFLHQLEEK